MRCIPSSCWESLGDWGRGQCRGLFPWISVQPFFFLTSDISLPHFSYSLCFPARSCFWCQKSKAGPPVVLTSLCLSLFLNSRGENFYQNQKVHGLKTSIALCELDCKQLSSLKIRLLLLWWIQQTLLVFQSISQTCVHSAMQTGHSLSSQAGTVSWGPQELEEPGSSVALVPLSICPRCSRREAVQQRGGELTSLLSSRQDRGGEPRHCVQTKAAQ